MLCNISIIKYCIDCKVHWTLLLKKYLYLTEALKSNVTFFSYRKVILLPGTFWLEKLKFSSQMICWLLSHQEPRSKDSLQTQSCSFLPMILILFGDTHSPLNMLSTTQILTPLSLSGRALLFVTFCELRTCSKKRQI